MLSARTGVNSADLTFQLYLGCGTGMGSGEGWQPRARLSSTSLAPVPAAPSVSKAGGGRVLISDCSDANADFLCADKHQGPVLLHNLCCLGVGFPAGLFVQDAAEGVGCE